MTPEEAEKLAIEKWNSEADKYNQWDKLSVDEQEELIEAVLMLNRF
jgi:hypothetical protein